MIQSLILSGSYATGAQMKDDPLLANCMMVPQVVEIEKVDGGKVHFKNGAIAEKDTRFKCTRDKFQVWKLTGELPLKTKDAPRRDFKKSDRKPIKGSYENTLNFEAMKLRNKIMITIENIYLSHEFQRRSSGIKCPDVYFLYEVSLLCFLAEKEDALFDKAMWMMSLDKTDLYFLLQPHSVSDYLLEQSTVEEWWAKCQDYTQIDAVKCCKCIRKWLNDTKEKRKKLIAEHEKALKSVQESPNIAADLTGLYNKFYSAEMPQKMVQDEARFIACDLFTRFEADHVLDDARFHFIVNYLGDLLQSNKNVLINDANLKMSIRPIEKIEAIKSFKDGCWALYVPALKDEVSLEHRKKKAQCHARVLDDVLQEKTHSRLISVGKDDIKVGDIMNIINNDAKFRKHLEEELRLLNQ
jgi:hypothetical protein